MNICYFHIGMPKTGTSSIQESLFYGLNDPSFKYADMESNACRALITIFGNNPDEFWYHQRIGYTDKDINTYRQRMLYRLEYVVKIAKKKKQNLILSAEYGWSMNQEEIMRLKVFMENRGYLVKIICYIRHWKRWMESSFQQCVQMGVNVEFINQRILDSLNYRNKINTLDNIFGIENVMIHKYKPEDFPGNCVVKHFCNSIGINFDPNRIKRVNDSLSMGAIKLLYTYRKKGKPTSNNKISWLLDWVLRYHLSEINGTPVLFHSDIIKPVIEEMSSQQEWLESRINSKYNIDIYKDDNLECIRDVSDMYKYDKLSLEWLNKQTKIQSQNNSERVGYQIEYLRNHPPINKLYQVLYNVGLEKFTQLKKYKVTNY